MDQIKEITENLYILKSKNEEIINVLLKKKEKTISILITTLKSFHNYKKLNCN